MKTSRFVLVAVAAALAFSGAARAADMALKAPPPAPFSYPSASGWFASVSTEGGGGTVSVNAPGVTSNGLISNQVSVFAGLGYVWGKAGSPAWNGLELKVGYTNFNASTPGLSWQGPVTIHGRWMVGAPVDQILAFFPNFNLTPPFNANSLPAGFQAQSVSWYISPVGFYARDDSITANGVTKRAWGFSYAVTPIGALVKLTNGSAADFHTDVSFNDRGLCTQSVLGQACGRPNVEITAGVDYKFGIGR